MAVINPRVNRGVKTLNTGDDILNRLQDNLIQAIEPLTKVPISNGILLSNISLSSGSNTVQHGLGRQPLGMVVTGNVTGAALSYTVTNATSTTIPVTASIATTASFWVF